MKNRKKGVRIHNKPNGDKEKKNINVYIRKYCNTVLKECQYKECINILPYNNAI